MAAPWFDSNSAAPEPPVGRSAVWLFGQRLDLQLGGETMRAMVRWSSQEEASFLIDRPLADRTRFTATAENLLQSGGSFATGKVLECEPGGTGRVLFTAKVAVLSVEGDACLLPWRSSFWTRARRSLGRHWSKLRRTDRHDQKPAREPSLSTPPLPSGVTSA